MKNIITLPTIRWVQRFSMVLTLACLVYIIYFLSFQGRTKLISISSSLPSKSSNVIPPQPVFDLKPYEANGPTRDIFSLNNDVGPSGVVERTPKGQLPDRLKVVGIVIAHPSQIIIEDSVSRKTYFIDEGKPQAGIKIMAVSKNQMIINYQGENISVPISKI